MRHRFILLAVLALSVVVRLPQLGRPLSKNHEFATGVALVAMDVWWIRGFTTCHGCPSMTYAGRCDGEAGPASYSFMQRDGSRYYISHLPLAYWAPFTLFKALGIAPSPIPLRIFNLLLHALTAFFFYRFLATISVRRDRDAVQEVPLIAAALYLLMPAPLWYHGNVYMSDMAVQLPWACALATGARVFVSSAPRMRDRGWFLLAIAAAALTEWLGLFVACAFAGLALVRGRCTRNNSWYALSIAIMLSALLVVGGALWLYADIAGWPALWRYYTYRWADRSSFGEGQGLPLLSEMSVLPWNIITAWGPLLLILVAALWARGRLRSAALPQWGLAVMLIPALMHLLLFLRYAGHEFAWLKLGFFLCSLAAVVIVRIRERSRMLARAVMIGCCALGIAIYTWMNRPGDGSATGDRYAIHQQHGEFIARSAKNDELICASGIAIEPQVMFYAHRNIQPISEEEGMALIEHPPTGACDVVWFKFTADGCMVERIARSR